MHLGARASALAVDTGSLAAEAVLAELDHAVGAAHARTR
jgi:hypothetical protein